MELKISVFTDHSRITELIDLFSKGLGKTTHDHWIWRIFTPNGIRQPEAIIAENEDGKIVGMGSILFEEYGDHDRKAIQFCDWVVDPMWRGCGIIGKIYRFALERYIDEGYDFIIEYPNDNSYPILQKYGFETKEPIGSWSTRNSITIGRRTYKNIIADSISYEFSDKCPLNDNDFIRRPDRIFRNRQFMVWKYDLNPDTEFKWLTVKKSDGLLGYFVFTITHGRIRKVVNIYDWEFISDCKTEFSMAIKMMNKFGNSVSIWGRYSTDRVALIESANMKYFSGGTRLVLKSISDKGYPDELTLTRIDTDY